MFAETILLVNGIHRSVKSTAKRIRPYAYNLAVSLDEKLTKDKRRSFFSGHASNAFATAVFTADVFSHLVWGGTLTLASVTAVSRYRAGLHYPTDLVVGAVFGSLVGWGIPRLHQRATPTTRSALVKQVRVQPWSNGLASGVQVQIEIHSSTSRLKR
ncbi:MAG: phosphatase PAP2 family protein [Bacteroidetes bacterium]|nr:phosphatase PAP2 family protein [Fibrella sp.]